MPYHAVNLKCLMFITLYPFLSHVSICFNGHIMWVFSRSKDAGGEPPIMLRMHETRLGSARATGTTHRLSYGESMDNLWMIYGYG